MVFEIPDLAQKLHSRSKPKERATLHGLADDVKIWVLTNDAKPSLTLPTLDDLELPYEIYTNPDWDLPADHPEHAEDRSDRPSLSGYAVRQYRAFRGHQEIMKKAQPHEFQVIFEDDMSLMPAVTRDTVVQHLNGARLFIKNGYDAVSFHCRENELWRNETTLFGRRYAEIVPQQITGGGQVMFLRPVVKSFNGKYTNYTFKWLIGCLAYMVGPEARSKWIGAGHGSGMPCDIFLGNELNTMVMKKSIFDHDMAYGSLISGNEKVE